MSKPREYEYRTAVTITRAQFDDLRRRLDSEAPSRAAAVCALLAGCTKTDQPGYKQRRKEKQRTARQHRHPGRTTSKERRREWHDPSEEERKVRELNRLVRKHQRSAPDEDGDIAGLLRAVAEFAVPHLLGDFSLEEEHAYPLQHWLMAKFGDVLRQPDIEGYLRWREECLRQIAAPEMEAAGCSPATAP